MFLVFERDVPLINFSNGHFGHFNPRFDALDRERKLLAKEYIHFFCTESNIDIEQLCDLLTLSPRSVKCIPYNVIASSYRKISDFTIRRCMND